MCSHKFTTETRVDAVCAISYWCTSRDLWASFGYSVCPIASHLPTAHRLYNSWHDLLLCNFPTISSVPSNAFCHSASLCSRCHQWVQHHTYAKRNCSRSNNFYQFFNPQISNGTPTTVGYPSITRSCYSYRKGGWWSQCGSYPTCFTC